MAKLTASLIVVALSRFGAGVQDDDSIAGLHPRDANFELFLPGNEL
jgi:hypothetical protein